MSAKFFMDSQNPRLRAGVELLAGITFAYATLTVFAKAAILLRIFHPSLAVLLRTSRLLAILRFCLGHNAFSFCLLLQDELSRTGDVPAFP